MKLTTLLAWMVMLFAQSTSTLSAQEHSIKLQTRMGTTSSVSRLRFANTFGNVKSIYKMDLSAELDLGYTPGSSYEIGATIGSYNAEPGADNGSFRATQLNAYGKFLFPTTTFRPHGSAGVGFTSISFRTPSTLLDPEGRRKSITAPSTFVGTGLEWRVSGFYFDLSLRYHVVFVKNRSFLSGRSFGSGSAFEREYRLKNNASYLSVAGGFVFDFPIND